MIFFFCLVHAHVNSQRGNINSFHVFALLPFLLLLQHSQPWKSSKLQMTVWCHALLLAGKIQMLLVSFLLNTFTGKTWSNFFLSGFPSGDWSSSSPQIGGKVCSSKPTHIFIGEIFPHPRLYWGKVFSVRGATHTSNFQFDLAWDPVDQRAIVTVASL